MKGGKLRYIFPIKKPAAPFYRQEELPLHGKGQRYLSYEQEESWVGRGGLPTGTWRGKAVTAVFRIRINWFRIRNFDIFDIFLIKFAFHLSLGLHKGRPSHKRSPQLLRENTQHFKTWNFFTFFLFLWVFFAILHLNPDPLTWQYPDPKHWRWRTY